MTELLERLHAIGLPMGSHYGPLYVTPEEGEPYTSTRYVGWTTDETKADAAREAGAVVVGYRSAYDDCFGWEVSVAVVS